MRKSRFSAGQISTALRQVESGAPVAEVTRKPGGSEKTYYLWKKQYAHLLTNELRELRQLREENAKLKRLVADLTLDKVMLQEVLTEND
jgi:putative transposase